MSKLHDTNFRLTNTEKVENVTLSVNGRLNILIKTDHQPVC